MPPRTCWKPLAPRWPVRSARRPAMWWRAPRPAANWPRPKSLACPCWTKPACWPCCRAQAPEAISPFSEFLMRTLLLSFQARAAALFRWLAGLFAWIPRPLRRALMWGALAVPAAVLVYTLVLIPFTPSISDIRKAKSELPAQLMSVDGKLLAEYRWANREWVELSQISPNVVNALIATEDHRFYDHFGLDWRRTASSVVHTLRGDPQGGSTITQQLARNLFPEEIGRSHVFRQVGRQAQRAGKRHADRHAQGHGLLQPRAQPRACPGTAQHRAVANGQARQARRKAAGGPAKTPAARQFRAPDRGHGPSAPLCDTAAQAAHRVGRQPWLQPVCRWPGDPHHHRLAPAGHCQPGRGAPGAPAAGRGRHRLVAAQWLGPEERAGADAGARKPRIPQRRGQGPDPRRGLAGAAG